MRSKWSGGTVIQAEGRDGHEQNQSPTQKKTRPMNSNRTKLLLLPLLPLNRRTTTTATATATATTATARTTTPKEHYHLLIKQAIQNNQPCRLKHSQIPIPTLVELWTTAISQREPPINWIEWLFQSTINQPKPIRSNEHQLKLTRFLSLAIGLLIRSLPTTTASNPSTSHINPEETSLRRWLKGIQEWQQASGSPILSNQLDHRRLQINRLLGQPDENLQELIQAQDPYILSTLLRSADRSEDLFERLEGSQDDLLRSIRVSCRSKGQLIHRTHPDGPHQPISSTEFQELVSRNPAPSFWRTGLILSQAECLVGQIRMIAEEEPQGCRRLDEILKRLKELLDLSLSEREKTLYGGRLEAHRLIRRQADGLEAILGHLLLSPSALPIDFGLILELIDGALARLGPDIIRPRSWKLLLSSHLKLSSQWTGPAGLERLFQLATLWSKLILETSPDQTHHHPPIQFKKIMPGDIGLVMIERVLFPEEDLDGRLEKREAAGLSSSSSLMMEEDRVEEAFEGLVERLLTMIRFLEAFGSPRRFKERRLMRLIFLSVQKRHPHSLDHDHHHHHHHLHHESCATGPEAIGSRLLGSPSGLEWWHRPDVWRLLEFRLSPSAPPSPPISQPQLLPPSLHEQQQQQHERHTEEEEYEQLLDLSQLHFQLDYPSISDSIPHHHQEYGGGGGGGFPPEDRDGLDRDGLNRPDEQGHDRPSSASPSGSKNPSDPPLLGYPDQPQIGRKPNKTSRDQVEGIGTSLDVVNHKLRTQSLDYFDQHSLLTCLILLIRNKFH
ncbi:uncharacterized protein PGTG_16208 [Puccinia graminis f. sp. tritici CRL 75-36-700-3]|uniref:Uncharacterized protein n=1 Tax=Puccinia graminis f. sp. tritici (strain CRL 75-36-700-3 / race SCCL) TaxID=418459 RepID=E3L033_PUCGT|nr:uncharacterized protein PGTG_16208 [Puccinia graminis f. sp. tritici CRL 75-36-700-3]EFP89920.2 hypothetical protein PGTG_16208 [Puccinia graminis f. sp. tritici CRL 75-36-700-3]